MYKWKREGRAKKKYPIHTLLHPTLVSGKIQPVRGYSLAHHFVGRRCGAISILVTTMEYNSKHVHHIYRVQGAKRLSRTIVAIV